MPKRNKSKSYFNRACTNPLVENLKCVYCYGRKFTKKGKKLVCDKCGAEVKEEKRFGGSLIWTKTLGVLIGFVLLLSLALALTITQITPTGDITTSNSSVEIEYDTSALDGLSEVKFNWDGTNYSIYDSSLVLFMNFDNRSALGESDTVVKDLSMYGNNGTVNGCYLKITSNLPFLGFSEK